MSQRTQISRTECPKQTLQSPNTAQGRSHILKRRELFPEVTPAVPKAQTSPSALLKGPIPATGVIPLVLKHQLEHSDFTLKSAPWNRNQPRHPPVQQARDSGDATQTTDVTAKKLPQQLILTHECPTTHWALLQFTSFLTFHLWLRNSPKLHMHHTLCRKYSPKATIFLLLFWTGSVDSSRTAPAHEFIPSLLIHLQVKLLLMSPNSQEILWSQF